MKIARPVVPVFISPLPESSCLFFFDFCFR
jgi:hypothetical protein